MLKYYNFYIMSTFMNTASLSLKKTFTYNSINNFQQHYFDLIYFTKKMFSVR